MTKDLIAIKEKDIEKRVIEYMELDDSSAFAEISNLCELYRDTDGEDHKDWIVREIALCCLIDVNAKGFKEGTPL